MIGNDIVDLQQPPTNFNRPRFLDKVYTPKEQSLIHNSTDQHQTAWVLWSMKEAAYKVHVQQFGERFFDPKRLVSKLISEVNGIVRIDDNSYYTTANISENYVYTIAMLNSQQAVHSTIFKTESKSYSTQSRLLKQSFIQSVSKTINIEPNRLKIKKTDLGVPQLYIKSKKSPIPFSLTHCGRFSGFVY